MGAICPSFPIGGMLMLLYKSIIDDKEVFLGDRKVGPHKRLSPRIAYEFENSYDPTCAYVPVSDRKRGTVLRAINNPNIRTIGINFVANLRGTEIVKGYCNLEVFRHSYTITKNSFKVLGNFDTNKLSIKVPIASLIVKNIGPREEEMGPYSVISFFIINYGGEEKIKVETSPYAYKESKETTTNRLVKVLFHQNGKKPLYLIPSQIILTDCDSFDELCNLIGRTPNERLKDSVYFVRNFDLHFESPIQVAEKDIVTICKRSTREDILNIFSDYCSIIK